MAEAGRRAGAALLGAHVEVGEVRVESLRSLTVRGIALYDKTGELFFQAESAAVRFSLFAMLMDSPARGVEEVRLERPEARLERRADGRWNYEDFLRDDSEPRGFAGVVSGAAGAVDVRMDGKTLRAERVAGRADFADMDAVAFEVRGELDGAQVAADGMLGDTAALSLRCGNVALERYLSWLPAGLLPEGTELRGGRVAEAAVEAESRGGALSLDGRAVLADGRVRVLDTEVEDIGGTVRFTERDARLDVSAAAAGQRAAVRGRVDFSGAEPRLFLTASSEGFDPGAVLADIPFRGAVAFTASVEGTPSAPSAEGTLRAAEGEAFGYAFRGARARAAYTDGRVTVRSFSADAFGGHVEAEGELDAPSMRFDGHVKAAGLDAGQFGELAPGLTGRVSADAGFAGRIDAPEETEVYGSAWAEDLSYRGIFAPSASASFARDAARVVIDRASLRVENGGMIGVEGTIAPGPDGLSLSFDATHVDLALLPRLSPALDMAGFADAGGAVRGSLDAPEIETAFSASDGQLFRQPFDSLSGRAGGSFDGVRLDSFSMKRDGKVRWLAKGVVGFTGARRVELQIDTVGARLEDFAAFVAPDQPITGDIDNIVTVTGTLDEPFVTGYISSRRGSYRGYLLSGMEGDYTFRDGVLTVQDFHIYSPLVDMDMNGTVDARTHDLDLAVAVHDIDLTRFDSRLPYPVTGHGVFDGRIGGTAEAPSFDGRLAADELTLNGARVTDAEGMVRLRGARLSLDPFTFRQNGGAYTLRASVALDTERVRGEVHVEQGDLSAILAVVNAKNDVLHGRVQADIGLSGTLGAPDVTLRGYLTEGGVKDYALTDVSFDAAFSDRVLTLRRLEGRQGAGALAAEGTVDLDGAMAVRLSANRVPLGMLAAAAGWELDAAGALDFEASIGGTTARPLADASLTVRDGGVGGAAFDQLAGLFHLRGGALEVEQLYVEKAQAGKTYRASAKGKLPWRAMLGQETDEEEIALSVSLDQADLGLLPFLSKEIEWALGETKGGVFVGGVWTAPTFDGYFGVQGGAVKLRAVKTPVTELRLGVRLDGDAVVIEEGSSGRMGGGTFSLGGSTRFDGWQPADYRLRFEARALDVVSAYFTGPVTASVDLGEGAFYGRRLPKLAGRLFVDDALVSVPSIPDSESELPEVILDFGLELGKHVHFYSSGLYDLWVQGAAHFEGTTRYPSQSGTISVRRGTVQYLQTPFRIREGEAYFNQVDSFLPSVTFRASARLARTQVFLGVEGPVQQMRFTLTSSPEMSQEEILRLLTLRGAALHGGNDESDAQANALLLAGLQMSVLGAVQDAIRDLLQLDEFTLSTGSFEKDRKGEDNSTIEAYNIEMGKYITDKIMLRYTQGINADVQRYGVRYDFNDRVGAFIMHDERGSNWFGIQARLRF